MPVPLGAPGEVVRMPSWAREGLPVPCEPALLASAAGTAERRQHGV